MLILYAIAVGFHTTFDTSESTASRIGGEYPPNNSIGLTAISRLVEVAVYSERREEKPDND